MIEVSMTLRITEAELVRDVRITGRRWSSHNAVEASVGVSCSAFL